MRNCGEIQPQRNDAFSTQTLLANSVGVDASTTRGQSQNALSQTVICVCPKDAHIHIINGREEAPRKRRAAATFLDTMRLPHSERESEVTVSRPVCITMLAIGGLYPPAANH